MSRIIHTDTYTNKSKIILNALKTYMFQEWGSRQQRRNAGLVKVEVEPNGEIVWNISNQSWDYFRSIYEKKRNDNDVRMWLAGMLKTMTLREMRRTGINAKQWNRKNTNFIFDAFDTIDTKTGARTKNNITVADVYCIYEFLMNRKSFKRHWSTDFIKSIIGAGLDPIATELEVARREEVQRLWIQFQDDINKLNNEQYDEIQRSDEAIRDKYTKMKQDLEKAYNKNLADLEKSVAAFIVQ